MKEIMVEYKPFWKVKLKYKRLMPEHWHEMSERQLKAIAAAQYEMFSDRQLIRRMYNLNSIVAHTMNSYHVFILLQQLTFMNEFTPVDRFIIKKINNLCAPDDKLGNMWFGQFIFADTYFAEYLRTQRQDQLNKFIAALYLPKGKAFDEDMIDRWAAQTAKIRDEIKYAVVINYRLIYEWLSASYPLLFAKQEIPEDKKKEEKKNDNKKSADWVVVFDNIVGDDIVNSDRYARLQVHTVFRFITAKIKEHLRK